ncbi:MAG: diaminopimelate epimerase [Lachnospiraceae bacterium]|nr:diaminopimelate epimerase [Lachnospiraceae bacterium]
MKFTKMHGLGNDYVYVNCFEETVENPEKVSIFVSDRHFGIGSDGLILIKPSKVADFEMAMYNADGSRGEMCGNGIRCVAKYVYDFGLTDKTEITVETLAGIKTLQLEVVDHKVKSVRVNMGAPILEAAKVPVTFPENQMINEPMEVNGKIYPVTCVSMGNPHCVTFMDKDIRQLDLEKIGPKFENHETFPKRTNTEFANVIDRGHIRMRVWERGSGETLACGTGACATAVAAVLNNLTDDTVDLELLGGHLSITYDREENTVYMTGPATVVFSGEVFPPEEFEKDDIKIYSKN